MRAIGIILAGGNSSRMGDLSAKRATAAMPMAGCYRAIDFSLSNMSNSHIQKVAVYTQYNSRSLNEHLNSSKWWDFGRKQGGLYIFTPTITATNSYWYKGTADALYQNIGFLKDAHEPYVVIASGDGVYKMDYNKVLEDHIAKNADITIVTKEIKADEDDISRFGVVKVGDNGRVLDFEEKPLVAESSIASIGVYVVRRRQLIELLEASAAEGRRPQRRLRQPWNTIPSWHRVYSSLSLCRRGVVGISKGHFCNRSKRWSSHPLQVPLSQEKSLDSRLFPQRQDTPFLGHRDRPSPTTWLQPISKRREIGRCALLLQIY